MMALKCSPEYYSTKWTQPRNDQANIMTKILDDYINM